MFDPVVGGIVGGGIAAGIGLAFALSSRPDQPRREESDPNGSYVNDNESEKDNILDPPHATPIASTTIRDVNSFLESRPYIRGHPRFGAAVGHLHGMPPSTVKPGHLRAVLAHLDTLLVYAARIEQTRETDVSGADDAVNAIGQISSARRRLMRRLVRLAKDSKVPMTSKHRLIDEGMQSAIDEIRTGCEEILHNANLELQTKLYNHTLYMT